MKAEQLAEVATLGSLLVSPSELGHITTWLRAGDFIDPWHGQVYAVLRERWVARQVINAERVGLQLLHQVGPRRADLVRVAALFEAAPTRPQPLRYAAMVLESSLRREIAGQGVLLRASALSTALTQDKRPLTVGAALVDDALTSGERRWQLASGEPSSGGTTHPELAPAMRNLDRFLAADRMLSAHPAVDAEEVRDRERRLIAALVSHPGDVHGVRRWLRPDALLDRPWRAVYAALLELVDRGRPVDAVTVAWQLRHSSRQLGLGPDVADLVRAVDEAVVDDPNFYSRGVAADLVRRTADSAARALQAAANNPGIDMPDLFETARMVTAGVRASSSGIPDVAVPPADRHLAAVRDQPKAERANELVGPVAR